jgi:predicted Zn-dependent protease
MSPMSVRWKPLIILSGVFLIVAVVGFGVMTLDLMPASASSIATQARAAWKEGRHAEAQIHFLRALQQEPRNARLHAEVSRLYEEWAQAEPTRADELSRSRIGSLQEATKYGTDAEPRRLLLHEALVAEDQASSVQWGKKLLDVDPTAAEAHYALALAALDTAPPDMAGAMKSLKGLEAALGAKAAGSSRALWVRSRIAKAGRDDAALAAALTASRGIATTAGDPADAIGTMARVRLRQLDVMTTTDPSLLPARLEALAVEGQRQAVETKVTASRLTAVGQLLDEASTHRDRVAETASTEAVRAGLEAGGQAVAASAEACYKAAMERSGPSDLRVAFEYATHLLARSDRAGCLKQVEEALKRPAASQPAWAETVLLLHEAAAKAALASDADKGRFALAEPHIKALIAAPAPEMQAVGHLFQGILELDRLELSSGPAKADTATNSAKKYAPALAHLKVAASRMTEMATPQALYGVALMLSGETGLGRQYLLAAGRLPNLEARYRIWAVWAMIQAGYPEDAIPVVAGLKADPAAMKALGGTLAILDAEIHHALGTPEDLKAARDGYERSLAAGGAAAENPSVALRLAQLDVRLGEPAKGLERVRALQKLGTAGAAADQLAVLILTNMNQEAEAAEELAKARKIYPDNVELTILDASLAIRAGKAEEADGILSAFLGSHPEALDASLFRARLLSDTLKKKDDARVLLTSLSKTSDSSAPITQLALLEISEGRAKPAAAAIAQLRARWKESASADLLDAQLAMTQNQPRTAVAFLDAALRKDPSNKLALFWKAQLDDRAGNAVGAAKVYESLARENPLKEFEEGLSLADAARWALATLEMENQRPELAIGRLEGLLANEMSPSRTRSVRWQLVTARSAQGDWPAAKKEIEALLKDPATTAEDRVRAANFHRMHGEGERATQLLDAVLAADSGNTAAVALRSYLLAEKTPAEAAALLRKAIAGGKQPPSIHLMLAAMVNAGQPQGDGAKLALEVIDTALKDHPASLDLIQARYRLLVIDDRHDEALAYVEARAKEDATGGVKRLLVDLLRDEARYGRASEVVRELMKASPEEEALAEQLVRLVGLEAVVASQKGDRVTERERNAEAARLLKQYRAKYPRSVSFPEAEAELAARSGQLDRALALSREIDQIDATSPAGPALRAQLASLKGRIDTAAQEYAEAVQRAPRRADLRLALAQTSLAAGKTDDALKQAGWVLEADPEHDAALLLKARALIEAPGDAERQKAARAEANQMLRKAIATEPGFAAAYHLLAEVHLRNGARDTAVGTLQASLANTRDDAAGLAQLIQVLAEPRPDGTPPPAQALEQADALAAKYAGADGAPVPMLQAAAVGFHKAGQIDRGLVWAERAASKIDAWVVHLNHADLLLAKAEGLLPDMDAAKPVFEKAVAAYDQTLKVQATSIEAVNNKAWILLEYLGRPAEALTLCEGLLQRVDRTILPADFFDTLGAVMEATGKARDAEEAYAEGLKRDPNHVVLNFHLGRLLAKDAARSATATACLERARSGKDQLPPNLAAELDRMIVR